MELIFLKPFMKEIVWGGTKIKDEFSYETNSNNIGEAWLVSANDNGLSTVSKGKFKGLSLKELYETQRELFGKTTTKYFPLLVKYIDAKADLSVQVHPNDEYAKIHENANGKAEAWYVLDCIKDGKIQIGHSAKNSEELRKMVYNKEWDKLLTYRNIKKGDYFDIPTGTVHAIKAGTFILEIQQNSDITYRFYDYDRLQNGKLRELHIEKSLDVTKCPHVDAKIFEKTSSDYELLFDNKFFKVKKYDINKKVDIKNTDNFVIICIISGNGKINNESIKKGDNFIVPFGYGDISFEGNMELMYITSNK